MMLYDRMRSGHCYRVRLLLSILYLKYEKVEVGRAGSGKNQVSANFIRMNPRGLVPVGSTPEQFAGVISQDLKRWNKLAAQLGLKPE